MPDNALTTYTEEELRQALAMSDEQLAAIENMELLAAAIAVRAVKAGLCRDRGRIESVGLLANQVAPGVVREDRFGEFFRAFRDVFLKCGGTFHLPEQFKPIVEEGEL